MNDVGPGPSQSEQSRAAGAAALISGQVYAQLLAIARSRMHGERAGHTLQATALVNEAWLKLNSDGTFHVNDRNHFLRAAAEAMQRILVDYARQRVAQKRGGSARKITSLDGLAADLSNPEHLQQLLSLDEAISRFEKEDAGAAAVVRLRFYAGLSNEETADALGISLATVKRDWQYARAWLYRALAV